MKKSLYLLCFSAVSAPLFVSSVSGTTLPADKVPPGARATATESNAVPQSVFKVPANRSEGRDPFFPNNTRGAQVVVAQPNSAPIALVYNGRSGTVEKPLAMINGKTFEQGETSDVTT